MLTSYIRELTLDTEQVGIGGDQVPPDQLGRSDQQQHHAGQAEQQPHHRPVLATTTAVPAAAFLISRPSNPVSTIVPPAMQHASVVLDHDQFHVPAILLHHHDKFQQQHQQPQQKLDRRSAGLEELIMGCTSSTSAKGDGKLHVVMQARKLQFLTPRRQNGLTRTGHLTTKIIMGSSNKAGK
ncbi:hypothetical protein PR202_ga23198 [Eleusine coracana subsp. coracana]|uniref:Uncharacterized protein n=1 Tax=Eleusine coracana subsp. coracana TaxID=191504 RepID=A0AAV5D5W9_ELECO|nr:hypothetical protein PR202_ga23198 [Eleusine coracana subsp. coracana]